MHHAYEFADLDLIIRYDIELRVPRGSIGVTTEQQSAMPIFPLKLQKADYENGFFNVTVDYDRYVRKAEGSILIELGAGGQRVVGRINCHANNNGTSRVHGGTELRDWFQHNLKMLDTVAVDLSSPDVIRIRKPSGPAPRDLAPVLSAMRSSHSRTLKRESDGCPIEAFQSSWTNGRA